MGKLENAGNRQELTARAVIAAMLAALALALALTPISNNDIWLHLKTGSLILEQGRIPQMEEYTFSVSGKPLVDHEWLAQVLFALADKAGGIEALTALKVLLGAAILVVAFLGCLALPSRGKEGPAWRLAAAAAAASGAGLLLATHLSLRPHLFTLLLAGVTAILLERLSRKEESASRGTWILLAATQVLWANLHGGFVVGIALAGFHVAGEAWRRKGLPRHAALPLILALAALVNPYGHRLYSLVGVFSEPAFREFILEWKPPFSPPFAFTILFWIYLAWLVAAGIGAVLRYRQGDPKWLAIYSGFTLLSLSSRRHISVLAVVTAPLVAQAVAALPRVSTLEMWTRAGLRWAGAAVPALLAGVLALTGVPWVTGATRDRGIGIGESMPVEAMRFMTRQNLEGRVFDTMAFGAYVTYAGWPRLKTYVDSRLEIFGGEFLRHYSEAIQDPDRFRSLMIASPFDFALLSWRLEPVAGAVGALTRDPEWELIYFDDVALLYARRSSATERLIREHGYELVDPFRFVSGMGFAPGAGPHDIEKETTRAIVEPGASDHRRPVNTMARIMQGAALQMQGRHGEAVVEFRSVLRTRPDAFIAHGLLGTSLLQMGDVPGARAAFEALLREVPGSDFARKMIEEIDRRQAGGS